MSADTKFDNTPLTYEQVLETTEVVAGIHFCPLGEDGEKYLALGHHDDKRMVAALIAYSASMVDDWEDAEGGITRGWAVMTPHEPSCDGHRDKDDWDDSDVPEPCMCNDDQWGCAWWLGEVLSDVAEANARRPGAMAVTIWSA